MKTYIGLPPTIIVFVIRLIMDVIEGLLALRLLLVFFGASNVAPFVRWVYETTDTLIFPFVGMFPSPKLTNGLAIEFATLFAIVFYIFVGYLITEVIETLIYYSTQRTITKKD